MKSIKTSIQGFGRTLSAMVMPNIGAFIAWGLLTALFIPTGWLPNEHLAEICSPMSKYLLPLLIAYTAGSNISGVRGGVTGSIAAIGVIVGSEVPMFIGAMIMGPLGGWLIKKFDDWSASKVRAGFEMLVNNFSIGIIGMVLSIAGFLLVGNVVTWLTDILSAAVTWLINHRLLPLVSLFVEPGKVMFLNNAINHGIFDVLGIQQVQEAGKSIIFLIETNPGPGLGVLLACWLFGKDAEKQSAPGAVIIHFLGGIHEIYFPYVLSRPLLLIAPILGSSAALLFYSLTGAGIVAPASPGSIIAVLAMAPKGQTLLVLAGVLIATVVSFLAASPLLRLGASKADDNENDKVAKQEDNGPIDYVVFSCDAGMGSSALGATRFKSRLSKAGIDNVRCSNSPVDKIPSDASVVVCQRALYDRASSFAAGKRIIVLDNFLSDPALDALFDEISGNSFKAAVSLEYVEPAVPAESYPLLRKENILVGLASESKEEAIARAGDLLCAGGYVDSAYAVAMLKREEVASTYMGMGLAIPHGTSEAKASVRHSGIVVLQYPEGVQFEDEKAYLVIGIAGVGDEHLEILARISEALDDEEVLETLKTTADPDRIMSVLGAI